MGTIRAATIAIGGAIAPLDLLPPQFVQSKKKFVLEKNKSSRFGIAVASIIIGTSVIISLFSYLSYLSSANKLIDTKNEIKKRERIIITK